MRSSELHSHLLSKSHLKDTQKNDTFISDIYFLTVESHWRETWIYRLFRCNRSIGWSNQYYRIVKERYKEFY